MRSGEIISFQGFVIDYQEFSERAFLHQAADDEPKAVQHVEVIP